MKIENSEVGENDLLDKYVAFVPELSHESIDFMSNLFNEMGALTCDHNYLVILRYFHKQKYK